MDKYPVELGIVINLCGGSVIGNQPLLPLNALSEQAKQKILEQCGYNVSIDRLEEVMTYR